MVLSAFLLVLLFLNPRNQTSHKMEKLPSDVSYGNTIHSPEVDFSQRTDTSAMKDKTILITGGASGLGAGFFSTWASLGANVIIGDINETAGQTLVNKTKAATGNDNLHFIRVDVTDWLSQVTFFREASRLSLHGGIDCVVANAGIGDGEESRLLENPPDFRDMDEPPPPKLKILDVNLVGVLYTTTLANSYLPRNPGSSRCSLHSVAGPRDRHLLLVASIAGLQPLPGLSLYCASKHAVTGIFRTLRITSPITHGIRVNLLCPYFVDTPILGVAGNAILAGGALATIDSVVEAATRLVAESSIVGRGLAIGPKVSMSETNAAGLQADDEQAGEKSIWDVYAHDFEQCDLFSRRIVALTNLKASQRGWLGLFGDLGWAFTSPIRQFFKR